MRSNFNILTEHFLPRNNNIGNKIVRSSYNIYGFDDDPKHLNFEDDKDYAFYAFANEAILNKLVEEKQKAIKKKQNANILDEKYCATSGVPLLAYEPASMLTCDQNGTLSLRDADAGDTKYSEIIEEYNELTPSSQ